MGRTPAYIFVVRHGNRLDAADKKWHLSSPTPYDPPLTYGGWLQARSVGNQISNILEQAKTEYESSPNGKNKRRRFKVVIHSSPFLRCAQTSIGISSGLAQTPYDSPYRPNDIFVSATSPPKHFRSTILRLDSFLGEWLSPEYFEQITPPPGAALMLGSAKAELLRREDYSSLTSAPAPTYIPHRSSNASLWNGSPAASPSLGPMRSASSSVENNGSALGSAMAAALTGQLSSQMEKKGYNLPKPNYAISNAGRIPDGFVAHARDECVVVDYQWDSMRAPLDFGDGGQLGEEWTDMHKRFRRGLKKMIDWYATTDAPDEMVTQAASASQDGVDGDSSTAAADEDVETVVILVSHGAGCNALIGAITHQPVLMDVGIASITMAARKPDADYNTLLAASEKEAPSAEPHVSPHQMYDIRMSAATDHLRSTTSTPISSRSGSADGFPANGAIRGRAPSISSTDGPGPLIGSFVYSDPIIPMGSRSNSASATLGSSIRRTSGSQRPLTRGPALAMATGERGSRSNSPSTSSPSFGLWSPGPSSLRLMDDGNDDASEKEDFDDVLPNFDRFSDSQEIKKDDKASTTESSPDGSTPPTSHFELNPTESLSMTLPPSAFSSLSSFSFPPSGESTPKAIPRGPILSAPIRIKTDVVIHDFDQPAEELDIGQLGDGLGGLWGLPRPPGEAERLRDMSLSKRRWTTTERV
ncbi:hypothetical protein F66182_7470 [Fusarium sp. NRRL 66182]|nr:hypothetical protein F66182_7470 [Fusarium sp. NRRL 66182]